MRAGRNRCGLACPAPIGRQSWFFLLCLKDGTVRGGGGKPCSGAHDWFHLWGSEGTFETLSWGIPRCSSGLDLQLGAMFLVGILNSPPQGRPWVAQRCSRAWEGNKLENHSRPSLPGPWRSANLCSEMMGGLQHHADYLPSPSGPRTGPFCAITWHFLTCVSQPYHLCPTMDEYRYLASVGRERGRGRALELAAHTSNICPLRRPK